MYFDDYPNKCPLLKLNQENLGTDKPPHHKFFEDKFIEERFNQISTSIRGVRIWSTILFYNTSDYDPDEHSECGSDKGCDDILLHSD